MGCHVLICDIRLPGLDGEQVFRRALPELGATPVIFITAFGEIEQAVRLMRAGADDYVTKPFQAGVTAPQDRLPVRARCYCARRQSGP